MIDDDLGWPLAPASWSVPIYPVLPRPDELSTAAPVFVTRDFDVGKSPHKWPLDWRRDRVFWTDHGELGNAGVSGVGATGAATLLLALESGTKVTWSWSTTVLSTYSGQEQRISTFGQPQRRFDGAVFLLDASSRDARGTLMRNAAQAAPYGLALPFEELPITADSTGLVVTVATTALSDWLLPGQRCLVLGTDGTTAGVVVQSITATTIAIRMTTAAGSITTGTLGTTGKAGGRIMPVISVLLDPQQGFTRYPVNVDLWNLRAMAVAFGWCGVDQMGKGATITTVTAGAPVAVSAITDEDVLIWDRPNAIEGTATEAMFSGAETVDLGALPFGIGGATAPGWTRAIKYRSSSRADWQWWKAFIRQVRGRQRAFLLSTNRPDFVFDSNTANVFKIKSSSVAGGGDYVSWFVSTAHRRIAVTLTSGAVQVLEVQGVVDNLDGTLTLSLDASVTGAVERISLLEQVRFERDELEATIDGPVFAVDEVVRVVQEVLSPPMRWLFDKVIDAQYLDFPPVFQPIDQVMFQTLGKRTLIKLTTSRSINFVGLHAAGGNLDGAVVCIVNMSAVGRGACTNESSAASPGDRFWNTPTGVAANGSLGSATWYTYDGGVSRWVELFKI